MVWNFKVAKILRGTCETWVVMHHRSIHLIFKCLYSCKQYLPSSAYKIITTPPTSPEKSKTPNSLHNLLPKTYSWIPSHCNIQGNERADMAAKLAHSSPCLISVLLFLYKKCYQNEHSLLESLWQKWTLNSMKYKENTAFDFPHQYPSYKSVRYKPPQIRAHSSHPLISYEERSSPHLCMLRGPPHH